MIRVRSKDVACPLCGAQPDEPCRGSTNGPSRGRPVKSSHYPRVEAAKVALALDEKVQPPDA